MALTIQSVTESVAPRRLDRTIPYNTVMSMQHGKLYEQSGVLFKKNGKQLGAEDNAPIDSCAPDPQYLRLRTRDKSATHTVDYWSMHWTELKALVESFGGEYKCKDQAINYLEGL